MFKSGEKIFDHVLVLLRISLSFGLDLRPLSPRCSDGVLLTHRSGSSSLASASKSVMTIKIRMQRVDAKSTYKPRAEVRANEIAKLRHGSIGSYDVRR